MEFLEQFPDAAGKSTFTVFFTDLIRPFGCASVSRCMRIEHDERGRRPRRDAYSLRPLERTRDEDPLVEQDDAELGAGQGEIDQEIETQHQDGVELALGYLHLLDEDIHAVLYFFCE